jgi:putative transposase
MMPISDFPDRHHPTHGVWLHAHNPTIVFLTVCTDNRRRWLAANDVHSILCSIWKDTNSWLIGRYVLMPDHIHLFCSPVDESTSLEAWVKYWKSQASRAFRQQGIGPSGRFWQSDHWDTRLRCEESYDGKWEYVRHNPVRANLVSRAEEWPWQGEIHELRWQ